MASCFSCRKRTSTFCFVHRRSLCDDCIIEPNMNFNSGFNSESNSELKSNCQLKSQIMSTHQTMTRTSTRTACQPDCVFGNYFQWLSDPEYIWPPRCALCNHAITCASEPQRLTCKCLFHQKCLQTYVVHEYDKMHETLKCPKCQTQLQCSKSDTKYEKSTKLHKQMITFITKQWEKEKSHTPMRQKSALMVKKTGTRSSEANIGIGTGTGTGTAANTTHAEIKTQETPPISTTTVTDAQKRFRAKTKNALAEHIIVDVDGNGDRDDEAENSKHKPRSIYVCGSSTRIPVRRMVVLSGMLVLVLTGTFIWMH